VTPLLIGALVNGGGAVNAVFMPSVADTCGSSTSRHSLSMFYKFDQIFFTRHPELSRISKWEIEEAVRAWRFRIRRLDRFPPCNFNSYPHHQQNVTITSQLNDNTEQGKLNTENSILMELEK
jgi:hypothetical protein